MNTKRTLLKTVAAAALATMAMGTAFAADITGAGATFPFPIYAKWAEAYKKETGIGLNYQSIGSSGGIRQIRAKTVAFGASDAKGDLRVNGSVLADMFLGKISKWNDPKLAALNPGKKLPDQTITIVHRADGSGTTYNWTDYLTSVSKEWADGPGKGAAVKWPAPTSVGGKGNEGVAANVSRTKGALGYVEYAYAKKNNIPVLALENKDGKYVMPDDLTFAAAAANADWSKAPGMGISLVSQPGATAYPVVTASFILMYKQPADKAQSVEVLKFFDWAYKNGKGLATDLDYVPLPDVLTKQIREKTWSQIKTK